MEKKKMSKLKLSLIIGGSVLGVAAITCGVVATCFYVNNPSITADFTLFDGDDYGDNFKSRVPSLDEFDTTAYRYDYDFVDEGLLLKHKEFTSGIKITEVTPLPGTYTNDEPIKGISKISMSYEGKGKLYWDTYRDFRNNNYIELNGRHLNKLFTKDKPCFFKVETNGEDLKIKTFKLNHNINKGAVNERYTATGYKHHRIHAPKSGDQMPTNVTFSSDFSSYESKEVKTYTASASYTDFTSCVNQIILFGENAHSLNIDNKNGYHQMHGYTEAFNGHCVPQTYFEFDVPLGDSSGRGSGRFVYFPKGLDSLGYVNEPLVVFTDDHYMTFQEYLNYGVDGKAVFGPRFKAEGLISGYSWTPSATVGELGTGTTSEFERHTRNRNQVYKHLLNAYLPKKEHLEDK